MILKLTVQAGSASGAVGPASLERVVVDTTVQEKAIAFPTDSRLYNRSRERLVKLAATWSIRLRQSYSRLRRQALLKVGRYLHARQRRRAGREIKRLKTYLDTCSGKLKKGLFQGRLAIWLVCNWQVLREINGRARIICVPYHLQGVQVSKE